MSDKERRRKERVNTILCLIVSAILIVSGYLFIRMYLQYRQARVEYETVQEECTEPKAPEGDGDDRKNEPPITVDFDALKKINPDIVAWVYIGCIDVSYPVVQGKDNDWYLHRTFKGERNFAGSIFMDCVNEPDLSEKNTIIYGHNMRDGSMFGKLDWILPQHLYKEDSSFWIVTPDANYKYEMFSIFVSKPHGECYRIPDPTDRMGFIEWAKQMLSQSSEPISQHLFSDDDTVVTLSTCTSAHTTRTIVQGYRTLMLPVSKN